MAICLAARRASLGKPPGVEKRRQCTAPLLEARPATSKVRRGPLAFEGPASAARMTIYVQRAALLVERKLIGDYLTSGTSVPRTGAATRSEDRCYVLKMLERICKIVSASGRGGQSSKRSARGRLRILPTEKSRSRALPIVAWAYARASEKPAPRRGCIDTIGFARGQERTQAPLYRLKHPCTSTARQRFRCVRERSRSARRTAGN